MCVCVCVCYADIRAGCVWQNCSQPVPTELPWGGYKASGVAREMGPDVLKPFLEVKAIPAYHSTDSLEWFKVDTGESSA